MEKAIKKKAKDTKDTQSLLEEAVPLEINESQETTEKAVSE
jgi:hypothetical protein